MKQIKKNDYFLHLTKLIVSAQCSLWRSNVVTMPLFTNKAFLSIHYLFCIKLEVQIIVEYISTW